MEGRLEGLNAKVRCSVMSWVTNTNDQRIETSKVISLGDKSSPQKSGREERGIGCCDGLLGSADWKKGRKRKYNVEGVGQVTDNDDVMNKTPTNK